MCGLTGLWSCWLSAAEIATFQELMVLASLRGRQGSGAIIVPNQEKQSLKIVKSERSASDIAYGKPFHQGIKECNQVSLLMGHARLPTTGGMTLQDCHPHQYYNIIGMHNGTMSLVNNKVVGKDDNDSKMLFKSIAEHGLEETLRTSSGEFALTWLDTKDYTLHFYRNTKRPLYFASQEGGWGTAWYASEEEFLYCVLERAYGKGTTEVQELKPFHHLVFPARPVNGNKIRPVKFDFVSPSIPRSKSLLPSNILQDNQDNENQIEYITKTGHSLKKLDLLIALGSGCQNCGNPAEMYDYRNHKLIWTKANEFICKACYDNDADAAVYANTYGSIPSMTH